MISYVIYVIFDHGLEDTALRQPLKVSLQYHKASGQFCKMIGKAIGRDGHSRPKTFYLDDGIGKGCGVEGPVAAVAGNGEDGLG